MLEKNFHFPCAEMVISADNSEGALGQKPFENGAFLQSLYDPPDIVLDSRLGILCPFNGQLDEVGHIFDIGRLAFKNSCDCSARLMAHDQNKGRAQILDPVLD